MPDPKPDLDDATLQALEAAGLKALALPTDAQNGIDPDALQQALQSLRMHCASRLWCVFGCGGDRDRGKRPQMGQLAELYADHVIITADNPRSEDAGEILKEMYAGVPITDRKKVLTISDRKEAIKTACTLAQKGDIILLAGKGHEKYQEISGVKHPFDDKAVLREMFEELGK